MTDFKLGDKVTYTHELFRTSEYSKQKGTYKKWISRPLFRFAAQVGDREGIITGVRNLANGSVEWGDYETSTQFHADEYVMAYIVTFDLRRNPTYVLPEHLTLVE